MMAETQIVRIQVISDLHTEAGPFAEPDPSDLATGADIVILAGDIARAPDAVAVAARMFPDVPLVSVSGNHENYDTGMTIDEGIDAMRRAALGHASAECRPVHVLEDEEAVVEVRGISLRFLGSCTSLCSPHTSQMSHHLSYYRLNQSCLLLRLHGPAPCPVTAAAHAAPAHEEGKGGPGERGGD
jgi:hypothetical protein